MLRVMDRATQIALNRVNHTFYECIAPEWSQARNAPWPGFARVLAHIETQDEQRADAPSTLRVLDVGAGDGRFAAYLKDTWRGSVDYCGVDASSELLAYAQQRQLGPGWRFVQRDFIELPPSAALPAGPFELVAVFGVLHHVPARAARCELVRELATRVGQAGVLALTFWRMPDDPRFASRVVPWEQYNAAASSPIALQQLEPGDTLLRWGNGSGPPRYCHFPSPAETEALIAATGLQLVERFRADGCGDRLNEYALLAR